MVHDLGMKVVSSHAGFRAEECKQVIDAHRELGATYIVYPSISIPEQPSSDDYLIASVLMNELGIECKNGRP